VQQRAIRALVRLGRTARRRGQPAAAGRDRSVGRRGEAAPSDRGGTAIRAGPRSPGTSRRSTYAGQGRTSDWVGRRS
jgi:hypothetical protein